MKSTRKRKQFNKKSRKAKKIEKRRTRGKKTRQFRKSGKRMFGGDGVLDSVLGGVKMGEANPYITNIDNSKYVDKLQQVNTLEQLYAYLVDISNRLKIKIENSCYNDFQNIWLINHSNCLELKILYESKNIIGNDLYTAMKNKNKEAIILNITEYKRIVYEIFINRSRNINVANNTAKLYFNIICHICINIINNPVYEYDNNIKHSIIDLMYFEDTHDIILDIMKFISSIRNLYDKNGVLINSELDKAISTFLNDNGGTQQVIDKLNEVAEANVNAKAAEREAVNSDDVVVNMKSDNKVQDNSKKRFSLLKY